MKMAVSSILELEKTILFSGNTELEYFSGFIENFF